MTMSFDDLLGDLAPTFSNTLGETFIVVTPAGVERTITCIVDRDAPMRMAASGHVTQAKMTILPNNNALTGIAANEFDRGGTWKAKIAMREGGPIKTLGIYPMPPGVPSIHDGGHIELMLH